MKKLLMTAISSALLVGSGCIDCSFAQTSDKALPVQTTAEAQPAALGDNQIVNDVDARIARFKADLNLTPDQEKNWPDLEAALRDQGIGQSKTVMASRSARRDRDEHPNDMSLMRAEADRLTLKATSLKKLADSAEPFYLSLKDHQKHKLAEFMQTLFKIDQR